MPVDFLHVEMQMTDADLLNALRDCYDPRLRRNVVELNMVRSASLELDRESPGSGIEGVPLRHRVTIVLVPASSDESNNAQLAALIENRLLGMKEISSVQIRMLPPLFAILEPQKTKR